MSDSWCRNWTSRNFGNQFFVSINFPLKSRCYRHLFIRFKHLNGQFSGWWLVFKTTKWANLLCFGFGVFFWVIAEYLDYRIDHIRSVFCLCIKTILCANLSYEKVIGLQVDFHANQTHFHILNVTLTLKPWPNRPASSHKWTQVELAYRLALGGQTEVSSQVHAGRSK